MDLPSQEWRTGELWKTLDVEESFLSNVELAQLRQVVEDYSVCAVRLRYSRAERIAGLCPHHAKSRLPVSVKLRVIL